MDERGRKGRTIIRMEEEEEKEEGEERIGGAVAVREMKIGDYSNGGWGGVGKSLSLLLVPR